MFVKYCTLHLAQMCLKKVIFCISLLKILCHTCDVKMYYIVPQCSKVINDMSSWKQTILHFELIVLPVFYFMKLKIRSANLQ